MFVLYWEGGAIRDRVKEHEAEKTKMPYRGTGCWVGSYFLCGSDPVAT